MLFIGVTGNSLADGHLPTHRRQLQPVMMPRVTVMVEEEYHW